MEVNGFILVALGILGFGLVSARLQRTPVTAPIVFAALGALVGPAALGLFDIDLHAPWVDLIAELTLIIVLFTDASRIDLRLLRSEHDLPVPRSAAQFGRLNAQVLAHGGEDVGKANRPHRAHRP